MGPYERKLSDRFDSFDVDGDGVLTEQDFVGMAQRILGEFGVDRFSPKAHALMGGARNYWVGLAGISDLDADGRISREEFVSAAARRLRDDQAGFDEVIRPWAEAVVAVADTDDDGDVSIAEWQRMLVAMGVEAGRARMRAESTDTDGDGRISVPEVVNTAVEFYTTENERLMEFAAAR
ncbi:EF-hand domain-containing protein [Actinosynnema sp. NPDC023658]|uniref:EF-hand domain-containing protein n=1 Tax=Actinosynnema sp. NPDC023658 TaxID=3155465 RepID=UPI0033F44322